MALPVARTRDEAHLYMDLHPCEVCGAVDVDWAAALVDDGGRPARRYSGSCKGCGSARAFVFGLPPRPLLPDADDVVFFGGPEPSRLLDAGEWLAVADLCAKASAPAPDAPIGPDGVPVADRAGREALAIAAAAMDEVLKFIPSGGTEVPDEAFWSEAGRDVRQADPGRFERGRLGIVRDTYREFLSRWRAGAASAGRSDD